MLARNGKGVVIDRGVIATLEQLEAPPPTVSEERALRALARGQAVEAQQKIALRYILTLGRVAASPFDAGSERLTLFRLGSQAWAQAVSVIAGVKWLAFPGADSPEAEPSEEEDAS